MINPAQFIVDIILLITIAVGCCIDAYCVTVGTQFGSSGTEWYYKE